MFPIALQLQQIPILLTGNAPYLTGRLNYLDAYTPDGAPATQVKVVCDNACHCLREKAGDRLAERAVTEADVKEATIVMVAGLGRAQSEQIHSLARQYGKLINVEDVMDLCDFYFTANLRRGDLVLSVSTSGASPTVARKMRDHMAHVYGPEWAQQLDTIKHMRLKMRDEGKGMKAVIAETEKYLQAYNLLQVPDDYEEAV